MKSEDNFWEPYYSAPALGLMVVAALLVLAVMKVSASFPRLASKPLIGMGCIVVLFIIGYGIGVHPRQGERGPIWAVLLGGLSFLYLWWLASVLFDLIYVWHHYIRGSLRGATMTDRLRAICKDPSSVD